MKYSVIAAMVLLQRLAAMSILAVTTTIKAIPFNQDGVDWWNFFQQPNDLGLGPVSDATTGPPPVDNFEGLAEFFAGANNYFPGDDGNGAANSQDIPLAHDFDPVDSGFDVASGFPFNDVDFDETNSNLIALGDQDQNQNQDGQSVPLVAFDLPSFLKGFSVPDFNFNFNLFAGGHSYSCPSGGSLFCCPDRFDENCIPREFFSLLRFLRDVQEGGVRKKRNKNFLKAELWVGGFC